MTPRHEQGSGSEGFTLVELLVAMVLLGLLSVMLFDGLRLGARAATAIGWKTDRTSEIGVAYEFLDKALGDARLLTTSSDAPETAGLPPNFDGDPDAVSFIAIPPAQLALGGFQLLHLATEEDGRGTRRLIVSWRQVNRGGTPLAGAPLRPSILLDQVRSAEFAYFGAADPNAPDGWQERWPARSDLPRLVRLRVVMADGWQAPDMIVAPRLANAMPP